jgi:hypothetical protein
MNSPARFRLAIVLPLIFFALAANAMWWIWQAREFISPMPGFAGVGAVAVTGILAIHRIWFGRSSAAVFVALNGLCAFGLIAALPWLVPIVHATTEELTMLKRYQYPIGLAAIAVCTIVGVMLVRRALHQRCPGPIDPETNHQSLLNPNL